MHKMMIAGLAGALLTASAAMASEPVKLTNGQMDDVTAGWRLAGGLGFTGGSSTLTFGNTFLAESFDVSTSGAVDEQEIFIGNTGGIGFISTLAAGSESSVGSIYGTSGALSSGATATFGTFGVAALFNND